MDEEVDDDDDTSVTTGVGTATRATTTTTTTKRMDSGFIVLNPGAGVDNTKRLQR